MKCMGLRYNFFSETSVYYILIFEYATIEYQAIMMKI